METAPPSDNRHPRLWFTNIAPIIKNMTPDKDGFTEPDISATAIVFSELWDFVNSIESGKFESEFGAHLRPCLFDNFLFAFKKRSAINVDITYHEYCRVNKIVEEIRHKLGQQLSKRSVRELDDMWWEQRLGVIEVMRVIYNRYYNS